MTRTILSIPIAALLIAGSFGIAPAYASEITGTLSSGIGGSTATGTITGGSGGSTIGGTVVGGGGGTTGGIVVGGGGGGGGSSLGGTVTGGGTSGGLVLGTSTVAQTPGSSNTGGTPGFPNTGYPPVSNVWDFAIALLFALGIAAITIPLYLYRKNEGT